MFPLELVQLQVPEASVHWSNRTASPELVIVAETLFGAGAPAPETFGVRVKLTPSISGFAALIAPLIAYETLLTV